ncbi:hypothetical protein [Aliarcobacter butzleri]|uniref:hypothetical protein n=1 Tax=Aliarcobacter butzleri TaxID=28197 RepID=UPI0021B3697E|nr:hypothetical protein [Aliarcobacter butzleri]MCT7596083.1 hypothetical protein [Aliarcobacter butzleri]
MKNKILTEEELEQKRKDKEFSEYLRKCSEASEQQNKIQIQPVVKPANLLNQNIIQRQTADPVDIWLFNSLKEDIENNITLSKKDAEWFKEKLLQIRGSK